MTDVQVPSDREYAPDLEELEQREDVAPTAVAVRTHGTVLTHELPPRSGLMRTIYVGSDQAECILGFDLGRKGGLIEAVGSDTYIGTTAQSVLDLTAAFLQSGKTAPLLHCGEVWARCASPAGSADTSQLNIYTAEYAD